MFTAQGKRQTRGRPGLPAILAVLALSVLLIGGLAACGDSSGGDSGEVTVTGAYQFDSGTEEGMEKFTLTLNDDKTFTLTQPNPEGGEDIGIGGTFTVEGDKITLTADDSKETEVGTVKDGKLVFETITWVKK